MKKRTITPKQDPNPRSTRGTARALALGSIGAFGARALLKRRNASLHAAAATLHDTVSPPEAVGESTAAREKAGPGHAPGHRHLEPNPAQTSPRLAHRAWRRWAPRADHTGHPPRV